jgi:hypothetical protein
MNGCTLFYKIHCIHTLHLNTILKQISDLSNITNAFPSVSTAVLLAWILLAYACMHSFLFRG